VKLKTMIQASIGMMLATFSLLYVLKLTGTAPVAAWPWWLVYSPLWGPWAVSVLGATVLLVSTACVRGLARLDKWGARPTPTVLVVNVQISGRLVK
jgi:hypothetical protein